MQLFDLIRNKKVLAEGGNVSSTSPGWQGAADEAAEEIDLKIHNRDFMVTQLRTLLAAQNESFKAAYGRYIWDPKLLASGKMFSGSSLQFFDVKGVNTQDFMNKLKKTKVGDIDTQIDQDMGDEVTAWLKSIIGKKVGNGTFLGFNSSLSSIWLLDDPQVRIQVDYELGPYDAKTKSPTEWFAYSHSSDLADLQQGIKGVFHKYINRALTSAQQSEKYVARVLKKSVKISDEPVTDSDYSFAVTSAQGGGMSQKYRPYVDPATGEPMEKDGVPVMQLLDPKDRDYIQNLDQQFQMTYGRKRGAADKNLQASFVGTIQLMNKTFTPEQNESVAQSFLNILFGPGAQMITKDDPAQDRDVKFAAVDAMLLGGSGVKPLNVPNGQGLRQTAVKMAMDYADKFNAKRGTVPNTEVAEDAAAEIAAKPNYARQGIKHLYNRLPDGRVSSAEMKDADFQEIAKEIASNGGTLDGLPISLKVDGAGIRFGKDSSGRAFFMTSKVTTPLYQDDVGYFTSFGQERGQDAEQLARTKNYDKALALITSSKFIQTLPSDTIVQAEMMYNPMAEKTDQGLKFVNIPYDPAKLGGEMTLVPFVFKQYSTGQDRPDADKIKKRLLAASDSKIKIVTNQLQQKGINVSKIIDPILDLDPKDKANKPAFDKAKQELSSAIIDNPKLAGKDALGDNMEGIVVNMPNGQMFKVTSTQMKSAMAAKMAQPAAKRQGPAKTAVVAIGSFAGHLGHEDLFNATLTKAKELGGDPYLFIGNAEGKDDPIPPAVKVQTWHKLYPQYAGNISAVMQGGSILQKVKHQLINPMPGKPPKYDNVVIMVGEDRADMPIAAALMKAVTKFPGYEHVKVTLETIPRTRPVSFTKLRDVLKNPDATPDQQYAVWAQGFDEKKLGKNWILQLMDISRKGMGVTAQPPAPQPVAEVRLFNSLVRPSLLENQSAAMAYAARRLTNPKDGSTAKLRAAGDKRREDDLKYRDIAKRNEEFDNEYDDEAGMAQSNLRTLARAVDGLLKTIKRNDNLPEWAQEKIAKAEMMLVSVWDYLQSQKERGIDPKVNESCALTGLKQIVAELSSAKLGQYKTAAGAQASAADKVGDTKKADKRFSGIVKATKKQFANDDKGVAEGLGDWIFTKIDNFLDMPKVSSDQVSKLMKQSPANLPDDVAEKLVARFMETEKAKRLAQQAAEANQTTVEKIVPYLTFVTREFVDRWNRIPYQDRSNALKNLAHNVGRFLMFVLETLIKGMLKKEGVAEGSYTTEKQLLTRIRQILYDRKLSGTDSNAGELLRLKQQLKDLRSQQGVEEQGYGNHPSQRVDPRTGKQYVPPQSPLRQGVAEGKKKKKSRTKAGRVNYFFPGYGYYGGGYGGYGNDSGDSGGGDGGGESVAEKWSNKYKSSINCSNPKGFSQKAHCAGKNEGLTLDQQFDIIEEMVEQLAANYNIDSEIVWENIESISDENLFVLSEDWQKTNKRDKTDGMSKKAVSAYRRENPGSKLKTAVTTKPSKLKAGSKAAKRRKSFCARMSGNKGPMKKPNGKPTPKALALRRWNCESVEEMQAMLEGLAQQTSRQIPVSEDVENIMAALIETILKK